MHLQLDALSAIRLGMHTGLSLYEGREAGEGEAARPGYHRASLLWRIY